MPPVMPEVIGKANDRCDIEACTCPHPGDDTARIRAEVDRDQYRRGHDLLPASWAMCTSCQATKQVVDSGGGDVERRLAVLRDAALLDSHGSDLHGLGGVAATAMKPWFRVDDLKSPL